MAHGTVIDYVVKILGIPQRWTSIIQHYDPPHTLTLSSKGRTPWYHEHKFVLLETNQINRPRALCSTVWSSGTSSAWHFNPLAT